MFIQIWFLTWWQGILMGTDEQGNRYYQARKAQRYGKPRRWVIYSGVAEASQVPPLWHAWLHHIIVEPPALRKNYPWQQPHLPNLTGKARPPTSLVLPYEAWRP